MEWIDVNDRLPEIVHDFEHYKCSDEVLCLDNSGGIRILELCDDSENEKTPYHQYWSCSLTDDLYDFYDNNDKITHWMPLPEPPK